MCLSDSFFTVTTFIQYFESLKSTDSLITEVKNKGQDFRDNLSLEAGEALDAGEAHAFLEVWLNQVNHLKSRLKYVLSILCFALEKLSTENVELE